MKNENTSDAAEIGAAEHEADLAGKAQLTLDQARKVSQDGEVLAFDPDHPNRALTKCHIDGKENFYWIEKDANDAVTSGATAPQHNLNLKGEFGGTRSLCVVEGMAPGSHFWFGLRPDGKYTLSKAHERLTSFVMNPRAQEFVDNLEKTRRLRNIKIAPKLVDETVRINLSQLAASLTLLQTAWETYQSGGPLPDRLGGDAKRIFDILHSAGKIDFMPGKNEAGHGHLTLDPFDKNGAEAALCVMEKYLRFDTLEPVLATDPMLAAFFKEALEDGQIVHDDERNMIDKGQLHINPLDVEGAMKVLHQAYDALSGVEVRGGRINKLGQHKSLFLLKQDPGKVAVLLPHDKNKGFNASEAKAAIRKELRDLNQLREWGFPVVPTYGLITVGDTPGILQDHIPHALDSEDLERALKDGSSLPQNVNQNTIDDLMKIRDDLIRLNISIHDLQYLVASDGHVFIMDPMGIKKNADGNQLVNMNWTISALKRHLSASRLSQ